MRKLILFLLAAALIFSHQSVFASENVLNIGIQKEPRTLNPFTATDVWSRNVIDRIYEDLYIVAPGSSEIIPWLAKEMPRLDKKTNTVIVKMRKANWHDKTPVTAHDVVFTANVIKELKIPRYSSRWKFVKKIEGSASHKTIY